MKRVKPTYITCQAGKEHACGQPCEESIYEIKGQEQIGRQEIYKQNRTEQNIVRRWEREAAAEVWGRTAVRSETTQCGDSLCVAY
jgi:hypothetical protein